MKKMKGKEMKRKMTDSGCNQHQTRPLRGVSHCDDDPLNMSAISALSDEEGLHESKMVENVDDQFDDEAELTLALAKARLMNEMLKEQEKERALLMNVENLKTEEQSWRSKPPKNSSGPRRITKAEKEMKRMIARENRLLVSKLDAIDRKTRVGMENNKAHIMRNHKAAASVNRKKRISEIDRQNAKLVNRLTSVRSSSYAPPKKTSQKLKRRQGAQSSIENRPQWNNRFTT